VLKWRDDPTRAREINKQLGEFSSGGGVQKWSDWSTHLSPAGCGGKSLSKARHSRGDAGFLAEQTTAETGDGRRPSAERAQSESEGRGGERRQACGGGISWNGAKRQVGSGVAARAATVFGLGAATRIYPAVGATDMRKGFNGLYGLVRDRLQCEPLSGHMFLFCNGQRNRVKLMLWDGSGLWVCAKKLEKGRFRWPEVNDDQNKVQLSHEELALLLGGIDLRQAERRRWYRREVPEDPAA
jgi:transposase